MALAKFVICTCNLDSVSWSRRSHKADRAFPFLIPTVFIARCVMWGQLAHRAVQSGEEEEGAFLPVPFSESTDSHLQPVHTADADVSPHLCCSPFPLSSAVGGLL